MTNIPNRLRRIATALRTAALLLSMAGCAQSSPDEPASSVMVNLDIAVATADIAAPGSRAYTPTDAEMDGYVGSETSDERMQTLRIVVVRPGGGVEHNRLFRFGDEHALDLLKGATFKVVANEKKRIYLFVNEETEIADDNSVKRRVVDFDLAGIRPGGLFPQEALEQYTIELHSASQQLTGPLPMSACHEIEVPDEDHSCALFVTRAAVKFTFMIENKRQYDLSLESLTIDKLAASEYYLPRAMFDDEGRIETYEVPATGNNNNYYTFSGAKAETVEAAGHHETMPIPLPHGKMTRLKPIYLLESRYTDPNKETEDDPRNYTLTLNLGADEMPCFDYFENLEELPRNTHVVVYVTIDTHGITWQAEVLPYGKVPLKPTFGLD